MTQESPKIERPLSRKKKIVFTIFTVFIVFSFIALVYLGTIFVRSSKYHKKRPRVTGSVYQPDKDYGYFPKPESAAFFSIRHSDRVPLVFDRYGFRVPVTKWQIDRPYTGGILFLGCSFTHGDAAPAEKTFPYLAAKEFGSRGMNAGMSGGGLCQMLMRARKEIPLHKPRYVVVQYSHWLVRRSRRYYRPTDFGKTPGPFYYEDAGEIRIHPPVFTTKNFDLPISRYARRGLLAFTWNVGIPLYLHDDYYTLSTSLKRLLGILPKPAQSREAVVAFTYKEIEKVCRAHGAQMVVLKLYMNLGDFPVYGLDELGIPMVDTLEPLVSKLPERTTRAWSEQYQFMKGNPPRLVDVHPNEEAHKIIAGAIVDRIRSIKDKSLSQTGFSGN
ncbi:MAG: hypothetical protein GY950_11460 [bacterium]|nr:hypothetical protein [bacterium]